MDGAPADPSHGPSGSGRLVAGHVPICDPDHKSGRDLPQDVQNQKAHEKDQQALHPPNSCMLKRLEKAHGLFMEVQGHAASNYRPRSPQNRRAVKPQLSEKGTCPDE